VIEAYTWRTSNGRKLHIMLEELGIEYRVYPIDIRKGVQFEPDFLKISPNNKIPAIVDQEGPGGKPYAIFESGAILMYLAEKTGRFMPQDVEHRYTVIQWLMFQMGGIGPMLGQANHFRGHAPDNEYGVNRYTNEAGRLYGVMDRRLADHEYLADEYSIADIACYPWLQGYERQGQNLDDFPNVKRWFDAITARPGVQLGLEVLADTPVTPMDDKAREIMYGAKQYERR
jgi:GSH-dependent disulfide-bond oxidoreductase